MPLVYKLKHDFENLDFWGKDDFLFFKMDEAWPNSPREMDVWFLEILNFFFFWKDDDGDLFFFFENEWGMAECSYFANWCMIFGNLDFFFWKDDDDDLFHFWK